MKVTILGFTIPYADLLEINRVDPAMATQTHRFAWSVVDALRAHDVQVDLLSAAPVSDYPRNTHRWFPLGRFEEAGVRGLQLPFVNLPVAKHLTRFLAAWIFGLGRLRRTRPDWVLVHGVHSPFVWFAVLVAPLVSTRVCVILTDPPGVVLPSDGRVRTALKGLDIGFSKAALTRVDRVVVLAEALAMEFAPSVPALVMEGLWSPDAERAQADAAVPGETPTIVYAGGLREEYGAKTLVEAMLGSPHLDARLEIYGSGPLEEWIADVASRDQRVRGPRLVKPHELPDIYARAAVLVQPRPVDQHFVRYSFPSKLIEYMASGTPTISTRLPSIPSEYVEHLIWSGDSVEELASTLRQVLTSDQEVRNSFGASAASFIRESRSAVPQGRRLVEFLEGDPAR